MRDWAEIRVVKLPKYLKLTGQVSVANVKRLTRLKEDNANPKNLLG
jgi:hypothetical protein